MIRLALLITGAILLTACASTQAPVVAEKPQYCNTSETVVVRNGIGICILLEELDFTSSMLNVNHFGNLLLDNSIEL